MLVKGMDRLPGKLLPMTFGRWCEMHKVTDDEYELLMTFWIAMRLRKSGLLPIMMAGL